MPLKYLRRLLLSALVSEGSKAPLFQRVAKKTARMERDAPEKVAVWTRAAYVEARKDAETLWVKLREVLYGDTNIKRVEGDKNSQNDRRE
ncbi:hypothetical protein BCY84_03227 [Trypanosoma cruzi cruzi]|nr:hypothetical protein TcBrA4_0056000 [Trypanosoma cruzi]PBJ79270.1 hypothetical protein BCY84_03227 [Trypanosoma cruzi cruzi]